MRLPCAARRLDEGAATATGCNSIVECAVTHLNYGIRSDTGLEILSVAVWGERTWSDYVLRWVFDVSYWLFVTILLISIVTGIIVDTFAQMRDKRSECLKLCSTRCFVCGVDRSVFEREGGGFETHIRSEHWNWSYLFLWLYLIEKPADEHTGLEHYVWRRLCEDDPRFFPVGSAICLERGRRRAALGAGEGGSSGGGDTTLPQ